MKKIKFNRILIILLGIILLTGISAISNAQVPQTTNYQGFLTDLVGDPVNSTVDMTFRIYDSADPLVVPVGSQSWIETHTLVQVTQGVYSVVLGSAGSPLTIDFNTQYWLGIEVGTDGEMDPRQALTSVPSALNADMVDGQHAADLGDITAVNPGTGLSGGGASGDVTLDISMPLELSGTTGNLESIIKGTNDADGYGIAGFSQGGTGVRGSNISTGNYGYLGGSTYGIEGVSTLNTYSGVYGRSSALFGTGVAGMHIGSSNSGSLGTPSAGVYGSSTSGWAGDFQGDTRVTGDLTVTGTITNVGVGDITAVNPGIGLTGGGTSGDVTMDISVPLTLSGTEDTEAILQVNNSGTYSSVEATSSNYGTTGLLGTNYGVTGRLGSNRGHLGGGSYGVYGYVTSGNAVMGWNQTSGSSGQLGSTIAGVRAWAGSNGYAGYFDGHVTVTGNLDVTGSLTGYTETDPVFSVWDRSTGISIMESQITDLNHFTTGSETDPLFSAWDMSTGISITESQISDLSHFSTANETDPTVLASVKDGVSWLEVAGRPAGLDDGDDVGITNETDPTVNNLGNSSRIGSCSPGEIAKYRQIIPTFPAVYDWQCSADNSATAPLQLSGTGTTGIIRGTYSPSGIFGYLGGNGYGVYGEGLIGVYGIQPASGNYGYLGGAYGVYGQSTSGIGGYFTSASGSGLIVESGNVGIGTTSPGATLHIVSTSGSGLVVENGNVGIGTTSPATTLHIASDDASDGHLRITNSAGLLRVWLGDEGTSNDGALFLYSSVGANYAVLREDGNSYINGGNVGIGTTSPTAKLEVAGTAKVTGDLTVDGTISGTIGGTARGNPIYTGISICNSVGAITLQTTCSTVVCGVNPALLIPIFWTCGGECDLLQVIPDESCPLPVLGYLLSP